MTKTAVIVISDMHVNSSVALSPLTVNLDDGGTYHASRAQRWLYERWIDQAQRIKALPVDERVVFFNGDLAEIDAKKRSVQLVTPNRSTALKSLIEIAQPILDVVDRAYVIGGTDAHVGKGQSIEEDFARDCANGVPFDKKGKRYRWPQVRGKVNGVRLDIAHHASLGSLPWTKPNSAVKLAAMAVWYYQVERKEPPPHLIIRSHMHQYADSGSNYETHAVFSPAWTLKTDYVYRIGKENQVADIGSLVFICEDGNWSPAHIRYPYDGDRRVWQIQL